MASDDTNTRTLAELAEVKGQLATITQLLTLHHQSTNQRIDDLRHAMGGRLDGHESRLSTLEKNERGTALRGAASAAVSGAVSSALVAATIAALRGH